MATLVRLCLARCGFASRLVHGRIQARSAARLVLSMIMGLMLMELWFVFLVPLFQRHAILACPVAVLAAMLMHAPQRDHKHVPTQIVRHTVTHAHARIHVVQLARSVIVRYLKRLTVKARREHVITCRPIAEALVMAELGGWLSGARFLGVHKRQCPAAVCYLQQQALGRSTEHVLAV
jgi:hypothetical protein